MKLTTILSSCAMVCSLLAALSQPVQAQSRYPDKPVRMIVPASPGSGPDAIGRMLGQKLAEAWGQPVVVENVVGASGKIGHEQGAKAAPDGSVLLMGLFGPMSVSKSLGEKMNYDPVTDLAPVTLLGAFTNVLTVHPKIPATNVAELVEYIKRNPGKVRYGHPGAGTSNHLSAELFNHLTGLKVEGVPYKSSGQMTTDLLGGHIEMMFHNAPVVLPYIRAGSMRGLAITSARRNPAFPELPTLQESGVSGYEITPWYAMYVPAGTPGAVIARLNESIAKALAHPDITSWFQAQGGIAGGGSPSDLAAFQAAETVKWGQLVKATNIKSN